mgnify:CR=1 FL=1
MFGIGPGEAVLIVLVLAFIFGAKRIPEIGASIGKAISAYKTARWENSPPAGDRGPKQPGDVKDTR